MFIPPSHQELPELLSDQNKLRAVDVQAACRNFQARGSSNIKPISLADLPVVENVCASGDAKQAVLSWRWDVNPKNGTSRNVTAALAYAASAGIEHLFVDAVSVDQTLTGFELVHTVADFTRLFRHVPVIAAYDSTAPREDFRHFLRVLRRPWIAREVLAMRYNPHPIRYVGHIQDQGVAESFGIAHMLKRIWTTTFANSILYVLTGYCDMHDVSELQLIMPEYRAVLAAASNRMTRNDALITAAVLSQSSTDDFRVNGDLDIRGVKLKRYKFSSVAGSVGYWSNWEIRLDGKAVGVWSEKDYTIDGDHRRKLSAVENAQNVLAAYFNVPITAGEQESDNSTPPNRNENRLENIEIVDLSNRFAA